MIPVTISRVLRHFFTGKDNQSFDVIRALIAVSVLWVLGLATYDLGGHGKFDPLGLCSGLALILFGGATGAAVKDGTPILRPKIDAGPDGTVNVNEPGSGTGLPPPAARAS